MTDDWKRPALSLVIPVFNEKDSIPILYERIKETFDPSGKCVEIIFINDGSTDNSRRVLEDIASLDKRVRVNSLDGNMGQHKALEAGFRLSRSDIIVSLDADLQNDPRDIPRIVKKIEEGFDLVCGWRWPRRDPWHKVMKSRVGNYVQRRVTGLGLHDISCTMRAYRRSIMGGLSLRNRFEVSLIPLILSKRTVRIAEIKIGHHRRSFGASKYGFWSTAAGTVVEYVRTTKRLTYG